MKSTSLKKNFAFNLINTLSGLIFPLITFPYVSRILLPEGIGQIQFYQSIINYIALFTALGLPLYAVREISKVKNDTYLLNKISVEILVLHTFLTILGYLVVFILGFTVDKIQSHLILFLILSGSLLFSAIGASWFYQGVEDFKYITIRALAIRIASLVGLFLLVSNRDDLLIYASITVLAEVGGNIFNFIRLKKYIDVKSICFKSINPLVHLRPALKLFSLNLIISVYVNLDSVMLGFISGEQFVGYYTSSTKITKVLLGIVQSLGTVLLPRLSALAAENRMIEFKEIANKAISFVLMLSLPLTVGLIFMAHPLILLFSGSAFLPAALTLQILASIILFISLSGIIGMQILYALGKENIVILSVSIGAIANFLLNMVLIPIYAQNGAAFATSVAEFSVTFSMIVLAWKFFPVNLFSTINRTYFYGTLLIVGYLFSLFWFDLSIYTYLAIGVLGSIVLYASFLFYKRDYFVFHFFNQVKQRCKI